MENCRKGKRQGAILCNRFPLTGKHCSSVSYVAVTAPVDLYCRLTPTPTPTPTNRDTHYPHFTDPETKTQGD